jgi:hypothetical protein
VSDTSRRRARTVQRSASFILSACLSLLATATLAHAAPKTKTCARINNCSATASSPPLAFTGGPPAHPSHLKVAVATAPRSAAAARNASGSLMTNPEAGRAIRCGGYRFRSPTTFQFQLHATTSARTVRAGAIFKLYITYEATERITNATAHGVQFCLGADFRFRTLSGRPALARPLPDGTRGHVGLLPPCPTPLPPPGLTKAPCLEPVTTVKNSSSTTGVDVILKARIPTLIGVGTVRGTGDSNSGDPWGGG